MRRQLTVLITFLAGFYFFLEFILPEKIGVATDGTGGFEFGKYDERISIGFTAVGTMAFALGAISILNAHGGNIIRQRKQWGVSIALIVSMLISCIIGFVIWHARSVSSHMAKDVERLAAVQAMVISSAKKNPIPRHMKDWPEEDLPPEINRTATLAERTATQEKLVDALKSVRQKLANQQRPPFEKGEHPSDLLATHLETAGTAAPAALTALKAEDEEAAAPELQKSLGGLRGAADSQRKIANLILDNSAANKAYDILFKGFYIALGSAMFSLLAFYIATAAYRAFRLQSGESFLLMLAALLVMLGQIPPGVAAADWVLRTIGFDSLSITQIRLWILQQVNTAAFRGIALGSSIAGLSMAWRVWWSMESSALLDDADEGGA
ncbi:MAG: hypothetical protein QGG53_15305 [Planctomycetota bacterium]|nr:hypothetical protein [Planctomycetota bacterium]